MEARRGGVARRHPRLPLRGKRRAAGLDFVVQLKTRAAATTRCLVFLNYRNIEAARLPDC